MVSKYIKPLAVGYHEILKAFYIPENSKFEKALEKHENTFRQDGNVGLLSQGLYKKMPF